VLKAQERYKRRSTRVTNERTEGSEWRKQQGSDLQKKNKFERKKISRQRGGEKRIKGLAKKKKATCKSRVRGTGEGIKPEKGKTTFRKEKNL